MPARKKRLTDFIRDRSFLARRHAGLLLTAPLVPDRSLRLLQLRYREETSELERRQLALYFERAVRNPSERWLFAVHLLDDLDTDDADKAEVPQTREELEAELQVIIDAPPEPYDHQKNRARANREWRAFCARDMRRDGLSFRAIGERLGVAPATARRYLDELEGRGF